MTTKTVLIGIGLLLLIALLVPAPENETAPSSAASESADQRIEQTKSADLIDPLPAESTEPQSTWLKSATAWAARQRAAGRTKEEVQTALSAATDAMLDAAWADQDAANAVLDTALAEALAVREETAPASQSVPAATPSERPATSSADTPCTPTELSPAAVELVRLYEELHTFKDDIEFLDMGFSQAGPYYAWMEAVEAHQDRTGIELLDEVGFLPGEVMMLGMDYMSEDPSESTLSAIEHWETKIQAGLALARCEEPGTAVQDIARASAEARRAYVPSTARLPAGADDIDERIINPCIAAAAQNDLGDIEPWELRNVYPEIYDPLVALIRAQAEAALALVETELPELDARARNILLDRFRDDCIRGTLGETAMDWSEAEVRELLSIAQEGATQYEIPLLNVDGEPYFPGERCDSPWVEYTPITADTGVGRHLSDTGWLCESTTPARFCHTLEGERGWEQGFFTCSSSARHYWLQETTNAWKRSQ